MDQIPLKTAPVADRPPVPMPGALRWQLRGLGPSNRGFRLPLLAGEQRLGSSASSDLFVDRDGVSRQHAVLVVDRKRLVVIDAGSKNGTFVNGRRVRRAEVTRGDVLAFGPLRLEVERVESADVELAVEFDESCHRLASCPDSTLPAALAETTEPALVLPPGTVRCVSPAMRSLYAQLRPLISSDLPVLLIGETGAGKDCLAEALHRSSPRHGGPLVAINCAAIPAELLEAELFGIGERVATGVARRRGRFLEAAGGTLFLDEIGEMPQELQAKLLRVLQQKQVRPLGSSPVPIDVRVLAATNADIYQRMESGDFRRDLFFRLAGAVLDVPPLRRRLEDLPVLVEAFLHRYRQEAGKSLRGLTVRALRELEAHPWPGNVRELEHEIRRLAYLCPAGQAIDASMLAESIRRTGAVASSPVLRPADAPPAAADSGHRAADPKPGPLPTLDLAALEKLAIEQAMRCCDGRVVEAAKQLGITRFALRRRLQRLANGGDASRT